VVPLSELPPALDSGGQEPPKMLVAPPGPMSRALAAKLAAVECPAFDARRDARAAESGADHEPVVYATARGSNVIDADGNRYVDLVAGFGSLLLGHAPRRVARSVEAQSDRLWLALGDVYSADVKTALKTAALATGRPGAIAFTGAYHGLSHGPLAACGLHDGFRAPFAGQLGMRVEFVPYPAHESQLESCKAHVGAALDRGGIGCILVEPILGRGGCIVPPAGFLPMLREACDAAGVLLVADEIWTGLGRSGAMLASVDAGVVPDLVCLGKGLGSGLPISACIGRGRAFAAWGAHGGSAIHTATHFGAPIACAAALATLDALASEKLVTRAREVGERWTLALLDQLRERRVAQVRGRGMMIGVEVEGGAARALAASRALLSRGYLVLTGGTKGDVLTLTPPLNIDEPLLGAFASALAECLN